MEMNSVQFSSGTQSCLTHWDSMNCSMPGLPVHHLLLELTQTLRPSSWWCHPAISSSVVPFFSFPQSLPASESFPMSVLHIRWPKYWSFSLSISPSSEYSGLISFRMNWFDLAVPGTLKSLLQHNSSKAPILRRLAFFIVQLSHPYMTTGKTIALTRQTFVGKVMSLLFNMLSRLVIAFLPRSKHLLISWLLLTIRSDFGAQENKVCHCFHCFPIYLPWNKFSYFMTFSYFIYFMKYILLIKLQ